MTKDKNKQWTKSRQTTKNMEKCVVSRFFYCFCLFFVGFHQFFNGILQGKDFQTYPPNIPQILRLWIFSNLTPEKIRKYTGWFIWHFKGRLHSFKVVLKRFLQIFTRKLVWQKLAKTVRSKWKAIEQQYFTFCCIVLYFPP